MYNCASEELFLLKCFLLEAVSVVCLLCVTFTCCSLWAALQKKPEDINRRSADMWSFAVLLWELVTREVPFADLSNMEIGMKVRRPTAHWITQLSSKRFQWRLGKIRLKRLLVFGLIISSQPNLLSVCFGLQVALEGLRPTIPPGISPHICKLMKICMNEDPAKRPKFDMIVPILEKMQDK